MMKSYRISYMQARIKLWWGVDVSVGCKEALEEIVSYFVHRIALILQLITMHSFYDFLTNICVWIIHCVTLFAQQANSSLSRKCSIETITQIWSIFQNIFLSSSFYNQNRVCWHQNGRHGPDNSTDVSARFPISSLILHEFHF